MLIEFFGKSIDFDPNSIDDLPSGFKRLSYQIDAVSQGFNLLKKHNGFFLSDVVGLGKTIIAILIAKKIFYSNGYPSHISRILIIVPPALRQNWEETCHKFGLTEKHIRIVNNGSLHHIKHPENYDLIIVDEAHKFRNDTSEAYDALQQLCKTPTTQVLSDGSRVKKSIILVSATPLNNRPSDIRNLVYLFQDAKDSTLDIVNLQSFFAKRIKRYKEVAKEKNIEIVKMKTSRIYEDIRQFVITPLTVRRTRRDLMENKQYAEDLKTQNIIFPEAKIQTPIYYPLASKLENLYDETVNILKNELTYNRYQAIAFLVEEKKAKYQTADLISKQLSQIMKTLLIKRLDSSFFAFKASLNRFIIATKAMITMFDNNKIFIAPNLPVTEYIVDEKEGELLDLVTNAMETDPTIEICSKDDFIDGFHEGLEKDYNLLKDLHDRWEQIDEDPKADELCGKLQSELLSPKNNPTGKVVIFSESKETSDYLCRHLISIGYNKVLSIDAGNRKDKQTIIRENFDANIPLNQQKDDYDILISTEVLSEGVNLHRSNVIVNYDTPWNSTKLMQRIGRVNRIGSTYKYVYVYNCYPTAKVDNDIELRKKAIQKLQAFHSAFGEDSQVYSREEEVESFALFHETLKEEKDERLSYLMQLRKFKEENPDDFRRIKNLSQRSRVGRINADYNASTITYLRNKKRDIFYQVSENKEIKELPFIEAVSIFKADIAESAEELHDKHHKQVNLAIDDFHNKQLADAAEKSKQTASPKLTTIEKSVVNFLAMLKNLPHLDDHSIEKLNLTMDAIAIGKFQKLPKKLNKLNKAVKKTPMNPDIVLNKALEIISEYPLNVYQAFSLRNNRQYACATLSKPEIIISESFATEIVDM
ncbi:MAG: DEAD/DEAH box helicase [Verrucomicrobiota bacterium]|nr:DEAD/DEAH box helicase [Verrucomicrobiota bacterium]